MKWWRIAPYSVNTAKQIRMLKGPVKNVHLTYFCSSDEQTWIWKPDLPSRIFLFAWSGRGHPARPVQGMTWDLNLRPNLLTAISHICEEKLLQIAHCLLRYKRATFMLLDQNVFHPYPKTCCVSALKLESYSVLIVMISLACIGSAKSLCIMLRRS